jgi:hypothetical protein
MSKYNFEVADTDALFAAFAAEAEAGAASRRTFRWPPMIRRSRPRISSTCCRRAA